MKKILFILITAWLSTGASAQDTIINQAEDLWGNPIPFNHLIQSPLT